MLLPKVGSQSFLAKERRQEMRAKVSLFPNLEVEEEQWQGNLDEDAFLSQALSEYEQGEEVQLPSEEIVQEIREEAVREPSQVNREEAPYVPSQVNSVVEEDCDNNGRGRAA